MDTSGSDSISRRVRHGAPELQGVAHATPPAFSTFSRGRNFLLASCAPCTDGPSAPATKKEPPLMSRTRTAMLAALALVAGASGTALAADPGGIGPAAVPCTVDYQV